MNLKLLKNKNLILLLLGQFVSLVGSSMQSFALSLYILKVTGSGKLFATMLIVALIPKLVLGPICGVFSDWFDRKKILIYLDLLSGIVIAVVFLISLKGSLNILTIYLCVMLLSFISAFYNPTAGAVFPSIVDKDDLVLANSANSMINTVGNIAAPLLAGVTYGFFGITPVFLINGISFFIIAFFEIFIKIPKVSKKVEKGLVKAFKRDFLEGIKFISVNKILRRTLLLAFISNTFLNPSFSIGLTYISKMVLKVTDSQYGVLEGILVLGSLAGPIVASKIAKDINVSKLNCICLLIMGILMGLSAVSISPLFLNTFNTRIVPIISYVTINIFVVMALTVSNIFIFTMIQKQVPGELMGRVSAVISTIVMAAIPLGQLLYGFLFDEISSYKVLIITFAIISAASIIFMIGREEQLSYVAEAE